MMNPLNVLTPQASYHARLLAGALHSETLLHRHRAHAGEHHWKRCSKEQLAAPAFEWLILLIVDILKVMSLILHLFYPLLVVIGEDEQNKHHVTFMVPKIALCFYRKNSSFCMFTVWLLKRSCGYTVYIHFFVPFFAGLCGCWESKASGERWSWIPWGQKSTSSQRHLGRSESHLSKFTKMHRIKQYSEQLLYVHSKQCTSF